MTQNNASARQRQRDGQTPLPEWEHRILYEGPFVLCPWPTGTPEMPAITTPIMLLLSTLPNTPPNGCGVGWGWEHPDRDLEETLTDSGMILAECCCAVLWVTATWEELRSPNSCGSEECASSEESM